MIKAEFYKFFKQKIIYITFIITFIYSLFANIIFLKNDLPINDLYQNFISEFSILYIFLILFYVSSSICDEYTFGTIIYYDNKKLLLAKFIIFLFYLFIIIILSLILSYTCSLIIYKEFINIYLIKNVKYLLYYFPVFIFLIIICYILGILFKKSSYASGISYLIFLGLGYLTSNFKNKFILSNSWNLNIVNNKLSSSIIDLIYLTCFLIILKVILQKKK